MAQTQSEKKAEAEEQERAEASFDVLASVIAEVKAAGLTFGQYLKQLEENVTVATRKLELAKSVSNLCTATKVRKQRRDKGQPRGSGKKQNAEAAPTDQAATASETATNEQ